MNIKYGSTINSRSLVTAVWFDNNMEINTLSNYHEPHIISVRMTRRKVGEDDGMIREEKCQSPVDALIHAIQNVNYSDMYYQIHKFNQIEAGYVLGKQGSKTHHGLGTQSIALFSLYRYSYIALNKMAAKFLLNCTNDNTNKMRLNLMD